MYYKFVLSLQVQKWIKRTRRKILNDMVSITMIKLKINIRLYVLYVFMVMCNYDKVNFMSIFGTIKLEAKMEHVDPIIIKICV